MMARFVRLLRRGITKRLGLRPPLSTDRLMALQRIQEDACAERRRQLALQREMAIYRHDRVSLHKTEGTQP